MIDGLESHQYYAVGWWFSKKHGSGFGFGCGCGCSAVTWQFLKKYGTGAAGYVY